MIPKKISIRDKRYLNIIWEDESRSSISLAVLRRNCPCAICIAERQSKAKSYIPLYSSVQTTISDIKVIGTYAIQLFWQDGHNTGIYTYDKLKNWK